uniref:Uncharacterized protein n=1 Tax=Romanomermis culicivorax TaxID=13658 RepID=A0A915KUA0_ROMCU
MTPRSFLTTNPQFRCLCGLVHVRMGALWIAGLGIVANILTIISQISFSHRMLQFETYWPSFISNSFAILFNILLIIGVIYKKSALLIIYLISQLISILITAAFIITFSLLSTYFPATNNETLSTNSTIPQKVDHVQDTATVAGTLSAFGMMILVLVLQI